MYLVQNANWGHFPVTTEMLTKRVLILSTVAWDRDGGMGGGDYMGAL